MMNRWRQHPCKKGTGLHRWTISVLQLVSDNRAWKRHPGPFSKSLRGHQRRQQRRFVQTGDKHAR